ncbi:MAG: cobalamin-dependent protein [bacterium]|nr:cobalamin-dependent protein [bacterium]
MKLLLIALPDRVYDMDWAAKMPNLGLMSIAGNVENCEVKILDLILKPNLKFFVRKTVKKVITDFNPDIVGLSAMTFQYESAIEIAKFIRILNPVFKNCVRWLSCHISL